MSQQQPRQARDPRITPFVETFLEQGNLEVMLPMSLLMAAVGLFGFVTTFLPLDFWVIQHDIIGEHRLYFAALFVLGTFLQVMSRRLLKDPEQAVGKSRLLVLFTTVTLLSLSLWITVVGYGAMGRYFYLVASLIVLFGLFSIPPLLTTICVGATFALALFCLGRTGYLDSRQVVTLLTYSLLMIAISDARYHARLKAGIMQEAIRRGARHDELTGALNRRSLDEDAHHIVGKDVHIMLADVDEFKIYNDLYGHATGDAVLKGFAATMRQAFPDGFVVRYGGDEFLAIVPALADDDIDGRVEAWRESFRVSEIEGTRYEATCSAGIVSGTPASTDEVFGMIRLADMGLYQAKEGGRNALVRVPFDLARLAESAGTTLKVSSGSSDALTGLPDAEFFYAHAQQAAPVMLSRGTPLAFAYFNVGGLKEYNERFGFEAGDRLLCQVADLIREAYPNRLVARAGEDRFLLMAEMSRLANTIDSVCKRVLDCQDDQVATLRAGIYRYDDAELLVRVACDRAKVACDAIRGRYDVFSRLYTPELEAESRRRQHMAERFETALREGQLQVHYQPIVRTVSDHVCDLEALARWDDPAEGMLEAAAFIGALEDAGLVRRLDLHVVDTVCQALASVARNGREPIPTSINLSASDFSDPRFIDELEAALERHGVSGSLLRVEVTEQAFESDPKAARTSMRRLHALGVEVWMDDFGSSSSALSVLRDSDFDLVKLDVSLVKGLSSPDAVQAERAHVLLMHIVSMAKELGMHTLAEGIEGFEELSFLRNIGCERLQGRVFAAPMPFDSVLRGIEEGKVIPEPEHLRRYYDEMGRVNLVRPVRAGASFDPTGTADGVPVAIVEHSCLEGDKTPTLHYLMANMPFQYNLEALAAQDAAAYDELMALGYGSARGMLWGSLEQVLATSDWVGLTIGETGQPAYARRVASTSDESAIAIMLYVPPVRRWKQA